MLKAYLDRRFFKHLLLFCLFNLVFYLFISQFHSLVLFNGPNYYDHSHHYLPDPRTRNLPFNLISGLAQYDSQWYLKIAAAGYTYSRHAPLNLTDSKAQMQNLSFAFFPLYPILIRLFAFFIPDIQLAAFILQNFLLLIGFISLYLVIADFYNPQTALKSCWLFFLFPFSIFFRSFYAEGLLVLLLIWFAYFVKYQKWLFASIVLCLINVTKGTVVPINIIYFVLLAREVSFHRLHFLKSFLYFIIPLISISFWIYFNYFTTGNSLYFSFVQVAWYSHPPPLPPFLMNLFIILSFLKLPFHNVHLSQVDSLSAVFSFWLLIVGYKHLHKLLWWIGFIIFLTPLLVRADLASYSRFQSVSFPLFVLLSLKIKSPVVYILLLLIFTAALFITSLYFVNWYWVG